MSNGRPPCPVHWRSFSYRFAKLLSFTIIAILALSSVAAFAEDHPPAESDIDESDAPKPYRQRALTALLTNERRSLDHRIEQVMRELERIGPADPSEAARPAPRRLRQELITLDRRLGDVEAELAGMEPGFGDRPKAAEDVDRPIFLPAIKPRNLKRRRRRPNRFHPSSAGRSRARLSFPVATTR